MNSEPLDFCRVKKIDEKGFGFLKSLYYQCDIFFHFSQIKKEDFLSKLNEMKRGDFFLFFTSKLLPDGRRKVKEIWYSIDEISQDLLKNFAKKITEEFDNGKTNLYDLLFVFAELKKIDLISDEELNKILSSKKILNLPTTILPYLNKEETALLKTYLKFDSYKEEDKKPFWYEQLEKA